MFRLLYFIFSLFIVFSVQAQSNTELQSIQKVTRKNFGDEVLQDLYDYRMSVEKDAYSMTISLCSVYRTVAGSGELNEQDQYDSEDSSLLAWMHILYEGAAQPFSAIGGKKADYLEKTNTGFFELESWFHSLYTIFLIRSDGFKQGAIDCLGTMDQDEIGGFAKTIRIVDILGSTGFYALELVAMEKLFSLILKSFRFVKSPLSRAYFASLNKLHIPPSYAKKFFLSGAGVGIGGVAIMLWYQYQENQDQNQIIQEWFKEELTKIERQQQ